jgi:4-hydroxybenzoate polyprenyltransferase
LISNSGRRLTIDGLAHGMATVSMYYYFRDLCSEKKRIPLKKLIIFASCAGLSFIMFLLYPLKINTQLIISISLFLIMLSYENPWHKPALRKVPLVKNLIIGLAWVAVTITGIQSNLDSNLWVWMVWIFLHTVCHSIFFDIKDWKIDLSTDHSTLAQRATNHQLRLISFGIYFFIAIVELAIYRYGNITMKGLYFCIAVNFALLYFFRNPNKFEKNGIVYSTDLIIPFKLICLSLFAKWQL